MLSAKSERPKHAVECAVTSSEVGAPIADALTIITVRVATTRAPVVSNIPLLPTAPDQELYRRFQFVALCWCLFIKGRDDGSTGLLPTIQNHYRLGERAIVSPIICTRFQQLALQIVGSFSLVHLNDWIGSLSHRR